MTEHILEPIKNLKRNHRNFSQLATKRRIAIFHGEMRYIDQAWQADLADVGLTSDSNWQSLSPGQAVSNSSIANCYKVKLANNRCVYFKRYVYPVSKQNRYWMRTSKAAGEVFAYNQLKTIGIPTLNVIAFGEKRKFGKLQATYIVTEAVENCSNLEDFARKQWFSMPEPERSNVYLDIRNRLFAQLKQAHNHRFFHLDLHWRNILIKKTKDNYQVIWMDPPRANYRRRKFHIKHGQMVDLSCLARKSLNYLSKSERYRALNAYLTQMPSLWDHRELFKEIQLHHRRSANPPKLLGIPGEKKQFNPNKRLKP